MGTAAERMDEMERLTERTGEGQAIPRMDLRNNGHQKCMERLAEYEDLEEQGKLLKLPCAVGDTVYVIPSKTNYELNIINGYSENNRVYEHIVDRIEISKNGYLLSTCDGMSSVVDVFYRETWFLTREEAEAALKKYEHQINNK